MPDSAHAACLQTCCMTKRADCGPQAAMVYNWPSDKVDAIVVTDGRQVHGREHTWEQLSGVCHHEARGA